MRTDHHLTPSDLDALPAGSVIIDCEGVAWQKALPPLIDHTWVSTAGGRLPARLVAAGHRMPLTLVHVPWPQQTDRAYHEDAGDALPQSALEEADSLLRLAKIRDQRAAFLARLVAECVQAMQANGELTTDTGLLQRLDAIASQLASEDTTE